MSSLSTDRREWLEADGCGGFASGTVSGVRTRRYHALLLSATTPPTGRVVLVNGFDATVTTQAGTFALTSQRYSPAVTAPDGSNRLASFSEDPWPRWEYAVDGGAHIVQEVVVRRGSPLTAVTWRCVGNPGSAKLRVRPYFSGRDYHSLHHENPAFAFTPEHGDHWYAWRPYNGIPAIVVGTNGTYEHAPDWYRNFEYEEEQGRGLDCIEDLATPGVFEWDLAAGEAIWLLAAEGDSAAEIRAESPTAILSRVRDRERRERSRIESPLARAAQAYIAAREGGRTIIAGYPWFTDWGRDTFIALRGLCMTTGDLDTAASILRQWAGAVSEGMLPNRFPDRGEAPEFNAVDASLWFVVAVHEFLAAATARSGAPVLPEGVARNRAPDTPAQPSTGAADGVEPQLRKALVDAVEAILQGYSRGTRYGIRATEDGLLAAGEPGFQLTWMDAKVGNYVVTPRIGKPVEVQALWLNALWIGSQLGGDWSAAFERGRVAFAERFWNEADGCLFDVVDCDHEAGVTDSSIRPNQILAAGGLPLALLEPERARRVVDVVESRLWTPLGLRSLDPSDPAYQGRYEGGPAERDGAYHQGTVWPWLMGAFVDAWLRARGDTPPNRVEAHERFVSPLLQHLQDAGIGHVSEIADGDAPHKPRGCPFQAWSLGELIRAERFCATSNEAGLAAPKDSEHDSATPTQGDSVARGNDRKRPRGRGPAARRTQSAAAGQRSPG